jgi:opacity protein-like surface antigen
MKKSALCLAIVLIAVTVPASASDTGFYLGAGIGQSSIDIKEFYPSLGDSLVQGGDAFKAYGGYRFLKFIAVEAGYASLGSPQGLEKNVPEHPERAEVGVKGWDAFAIGILPVSNVVDIFGKIGMMSWDTDIKSVQDGEVVYSESSTGTDTAYGIGIGFWVGQNVTLRAEGEWFTIGDYETVALYSANVTFTF